MEARTWEDTVMSEDQIHTIAISTPVITGVEQMAVACEVARAQAQISFKAGMGEVVERYKRDNPSYYRKYKTYWDLLEKEWGL